MCYLILGYTDNSSYNLIMNKLNRGAHGRSYMSQTGSFEQICT